MMVCHILKKPKYLFMVKIDWSTRVNQSSFFEILKKNKYIFFIVDGVEISTAASFELDKPYSTQRNGIDEITLCTQTQVVQCILII